MVTAERAQQQPSEDAARARQAARDYLNAANAFLTQPAPQLIVVGGLSGTGKSTLARALAPELGSEPGAVHLRSDLERKRLHGVAETVRLAPEAYTQAASDAVYAVLYERARDTLAARHAVIVDAVFAKPEERARIETVAIELGVAFQGLWLASSRRSGSDPPLSQHWLVSTSMRDQASSEHSTPAIARVNTCGGLRCHGRGTSGSDLENGKQH
jgi:predicted kinase